MNASVNDLILNKHIGSTERLLQQSFKTGLSELEDFVLTSNAFYAVLDSVSIQREETRFPGLLFKPELPLSSTIALKLKSLFCSRLLPQ